jgi:hypothetical protein
MKINKIIIVLFCAIILLLIGSGITTIIGLAVIHPQPPKPMATVQMKFVPQSLTMERGESKVITVILDCCLLSKVGNIPDEELGKIETVKIGMLASGYPNTARLPGITTKFNQEFLTLKINQTTYLNLTVSVDDTAKPGTYPLFIDLYNNNSTPDMYVASQSHYLGNYINLTIIGTGLAAAETTTITVNPNALQTTIPTEIPKTPAFDSLSAILALLAVLIIKRN